MNTSWCSTCWACSISGASASRSPGGAAGRAKNTAMTDRTASAAITTKVTRQPKALPIAVPPGRPRMLAMVMPPTNIESAAPFRWYELTDRNAGDAEEHTVAAGRDQPRAEQELVVRRESAKQLANGEDGHNAQDRRLQRNAGHEQTEDRSADGDPRRIAGH